MNKETVAQNLRAERARRGISRASLADMSGVSVAMIGKYERGEVMMGLDIAAKLADVLDCSIDLLAGTSN